MGKIFDTNPIYHLLARYYSS